MMRTSRILLVALLTAAPAGAQQPPAAPTEPSVPASALAADADTGELVVGARLNASEDVGRFFRYDDLRSGPTLQRLQVSRQRRDWTFGASASNAGYRDQQYVVAFERYGRLRASFDFNQVPLWFGNVEQTPYREETPG